MSEIVSHLRRGGRGVLAVTLAWLAPLARWPMAGLSCPLGSWRRPADGPQPA